MKLRWSFRAANDRGPQAESRVLFEAPKKTDTHLSVCLFLCFRYDSNLCQRNSTDVSAAVICIVTEALAVRDEAR